MSGLRIARDLELPLEMVTEPIGVMANRGRGKTYATHALVEEIHDAGVPVVILDIKGDWWGLRTSANGKGDGLPFYIFGGDHADLPLEATAGELLADLVVNERVSVVLDLSHLSKTKARTFTTAFSERLYHRNRAALFVVVDEADVLIPQRQSAETARLIGAMEDLAKRGRGRGIGMAVVTQRPQEVAKSVLDLMDTLVLLGMTGPKSLKAINDWISLHVDEETSAADVMATLPSLPIGQAWVWSPMQNLLRRINVRRIRTFDSHVTPKAGEETATPQRRASLDLASLGEQIAATVERAKADDPKALRARIRELEVETEKLRNTVPPRPEVQLVHVPAVTAEVLSDFTSRAGPLSELLTTVRDELQRIHDLPEAAKQGQPAARSSAPRRDRASRTTGRAPVAGTATRQKNPPAARETRPAAADGDPTVPPARRKLLEALVALESIGVTAAPRNQVALFAGVSPKSSGYSNNLGAMNTAGLITYPTKGRVQITDAGRAHVDEVPQLATSDELHRQVEGVVSPARWRILEPLINAYPDPLSRDDLADQAGVSPSSSGYSNNLGALRSLGLLDYPERGQVIASDLLFLEDR